MTRLDDIENSVQGSPARRMHVGTSWEFSVEIPTKDFYWLVSRMRELTKALDWYESQVARKNWSILDSDAGNLARAALSGPHAPKVGE